MTSEAIIQFRLLEENIDATLAVVASMTKQLDAAYRKLTPDELRELDAQEVAESGFVAPEPAEPVSPEREALGRLYMNARHAAHGFDPDSYVHRQRADDLDRWENRNRQDKEADCDAGEYFAERLRAMDMAAKPVTP